MRTTKKVTEEELEMSAESLLECFEDIPDPRIQRSQLHPLPSILGLSLCAILSGADSFSGIEDFGHIRHSWLETFLDLPNGIPSHDTIGRVFAMLDPIALREAFTRWAQSIASLKKGEVVAIDGKTLRRSFQDANKSAFVHMVSAWATQNRMVLGQVKTEDKSNEITAIPQLLETLKIEGCIVTIDAIGCQKEIADKIIKRGADYMLGVKNNQSSLAAATSGIFDEALRDPGFQTAHNYHETREKGHGRTEVRRCWTLSLGQDMGEPFDSWKGARSIVLVERQRKVGDKTSVQRAFYISSCDEPTAKDALAATRAHWSIENEVHWVLDVVFREDDSRVRVYNAAENFAVLRHVALNLLKAVPTGPRGKKIGIKRKRMAAGMQEDYFYRVLGLTE